MSSRTKLLAAFALGATFSNICQIVTHYALGTTWLHPDH